MSKSLPTYAIWIEEASSGYFDTIYVTGKAGKDEWILADTRPESVPVWYGIRDKQQPGNMDVDAVSGATPANETVRIYWQVPPQLIYKKVSMYIEANNSYDYNEYYTKQSGSAGYSGTNGQPSVVWKAVLDLADAPVEDLTPEIVGHGHVLGIDHRIDPDVSKLTTAKDTFQYVGISYLPQKQ